MLEVPLTSVAIKEEEIARIAVRRVMDRIKDNSLPYERILVKPELVERKSCAALGGMTRQ